MLNYTGAINHIGLSSSDLAKSKNFYSFLLVDLMGYQIGMDEPSCLMFGRKTGEGKSPFRYCFLSSAWASLLT